MSEGGRERREGGREGRMEEGGREGERGSVGTREGGSEEGGKTIT